MTIQAFIEKAMEGGWTPKGIGNHPDFRFAWYHKSNEGSEGASWAFNYPRDKEGGSITAYEVLLDPLAWKAVGKVEGWTDGSIVGHNFKRAETGADRRDVDECGYRFQQLSVWLWCGKTIEQYLETL